MARNSIYLALMNMFILVIGGSAWATSLCPELFIFRQNSLRSLPLVLEKATIEKDKFVLEDGLVSGEASEAAKEAIEKYPRLNGDKSLDVNVYGGGLRPIAFDKVPEEIKKIFSEHLEKLNALLSERFKNVEFLKASIRVSAQGEFDVAHLHLDFGGFDPNTYSTSTTINLDGHGTLIARPQAVEQFAKLPEGAHPLEYRDPDNGGFLKVPGYGIRTENLIETPAGSTLIIHRSFDGGSKTVARLTGRKTKEEQVEQIYQSGPWHTSPALLPIRNPKRFWIGVIFYAEKKN